MSENTHVCQGRYKGAAGDYKERGGCPREKVHRWRRALSRERRLSLDFHRYGVVRDGECFYSVFASALVCDALLPTERAGVSAVQVTDAGHTVFALAGHGGEGEMLGVCGFVNS